MAVASRLNFPTPTPALIGTSGKAGEMTGRRGGGQYQPACLCRWMIHPHGRVSDGRFRRTNFRLVVENISSQTSWQVNIGKELKRQQTTERIIITLLVLGLIRLHLCLVYFVLFLSLSTSCKRLSLGLLVVSVWVSLLTYWSSPKSALALASYQSLALIVVIPCLGTSLLHKITFLLMLCTEGKH